MSAIFSRCRLGALGTVTLMAAVGLSACDTSASGDDGSGPIKVFQIAPIESPVYSAVELVPSAQSAVDRVNAAGGIHGRKIELISCNDKYDVTAAVACAQRAVQENAVAVVGSLSAFADQTGPILAKRRIANIAPNGLVPSDYTNELVYLTDPGVAAYTGAPHVLSKYAGAHKLATFMVENPSVGVVNDYFTAGAEASGTEIVERIAVPVDATDWLPYVQQAERAGADAIVTSLTPEGTLKLWSALLAGGLVDRLPISITSTSVGPEYLAEADPKAITNTYGVAEVPLLTSDAPYVKDYLSDMEKIDGKVPPTSVGMRAWMSVQLFAKIAGTIDGDITAASVADAMDAASNVSIDWVKGLTWPGPVSGKPRIGYPEVGANKIENGAYVDLGEFNPFESS